MSVPVPNTASSSVSWSAAVVRVSPQACAAVVAVRPSRSLAASRADAPPTAASSAVAASLSLRSIIATA